VVNSWPPLPYCLPAPEFFNSTEAFGNPPFFRSPIIVLELIRGTTFNCVFNSPDHLFTPRDPTSFLGGARPANTMKFHDCVTGCAEVACLCRPISWPCLSSNCDHSGPWLMMTACRGCVFQSLLPSIQLGLSCDAFRDRSSARSSFFWQCCFFIHVLFPPKSICGNTSRFHILPPSVNYSSGGRPAWWPTLPGPFGNGPHPMVYLLFPSACPVSLRGWAWSTLVLGGFSGLIVGGGHPCCCGHVGRESSAGAAASNARLRLRNGTNGAPWATVLD